MFKRCKVGKTTLYREERYSGLVSRTVLKTSLGWKQFGLSLTIEKIQISMIRKESFAKKIYQLCSLSQSTRQLSRRAIKRANPTLNERESELLFIKYIYGSDLAIRFRHNSLNNFKTSITNSITTIVGHINLLCLDIYQGFDN